VTATVADPDLMRLGEVIQAGSKSFATASNLFDAETRESARLLYAWCRHCDDCIDGQDLGHGQAVPGTLDPGAELALLRAQTADALQGKPTSHPAFAALQMLVRKHAIPVAHPQALLDGFQMDVEGRRYATLKETMSYCYHVAGVVGVMMAMVMGVRDDATLDRASDLGLAFQLTNLARDVVDDARLGRVYLPGEWLETAGVAAEPRAIADPRNRERVASVVARLLLEADRYYTSSTVGLSQLPMRSAWAVATAHMVYRKIGVEVLRKGPRAWDQRVSTSAVQKLTAVTRGAGSAIFAGTAAKFRTMPARDALWTRPRV
jgi:phytoene synthase